MTRLGLGFVHGGDLGPVAFRSVAISMVVRSRAVTGSGSTATAASGRSPDPAAAGRAGTSRPAARAAGGERHGRPDDRGDDPPGSGSELLETGLLGGREDVLAGAPAGPGTVG